MKRPSTALIVASLALLVALSGTAVASSGLITGAQIKDHSIGMVDISTLAVAKLRGHAGPAGPPGADGAQGAAGPTGPAGLPGGFNPAKISYVVGPAQDVPPFAQTGTAAILTALCPAGTKAIAGGGFNSIAQEGDSEARSDGSGWTVIVINTTSVTATQLHAFAVCASS